MTTLKRGDRYVSTVWLDQNHQPLLVKITKVTSSAIYYRPDYGTHDDGSEWLGSPALIDNTPEAIQKWLRTEAK